MNPDDRQHVSHESIYNATDLRVHDQDALDSIADLMNNRPRQTLDRRSPYRAFRDATAIEEQQGATIH